MIGRNSKDFLGESTEELEKAQRSRKGASATEFIQVFFSLLLEFLLIFDFFFCMFVLMFNILFFGVDGKSHNLFC